MATEIAKNKPQNGRELREAIVKVWHHTISTEYVQTLIDSMPRRIDAVIKAKGGTTKY